MTSAHNWPKTAISLCVHGKNWLILLIIILIIILLILLLKCKENFTTKPHLKSYLQSTYI